MGAVSRCCRRISLQQQQLLLLVVAYLIPISPINGPGGALMFRSILILGVRSDLMEGYSSIEIGNCTSEAAQMRALAKLSNGPNQQSWWSLANAPWHDSALERFFAAGPLQADQMQKLAEAGVNHRRDPWATSGIRLTNMRRGGHGKVQDLQQALENLSTATYSTSKTVKGIGKIEASMRTIFFRCRTSSSCEEGYMVPLVVTQAYKDTSAAAGGNDSFHTTNYREEDADDHLSYGSLWLHATSTLLLNAIPSFIDGTATRQHRITGDELSIIINVHDNVRRCPSTGFVSYRSHLDASYGLVPHSTCVSFTSSSPGHGQDHPLPPKFKLLMSMPAPYRGSSTATSSADHRSPLMPSSVLGILRRHGFQLNVSTGPYNYSWGQHPFDECSDAPHLTAMMAALQDGSPSVITICYKNVCVDAQLDEDMAECTGADKLNFLQLVARLSDSCSLIEDPNEKLSTKLDAAKAEKLVDARVKCTVRSAADDHIQCRANVSLLKMDINGPSYFLSPTSKWASSRGADTSEFINQAPRHISSMSAACITNVSSLVLPNSSQSSFLSELQIHARASLNGFIEAHAIEFNLEKGPATDFRGFLALVVSTAISVLFGFAGPSFTNILMRLINGQRWKRVPIVLLLPLINVVLSLLSFLPVIYMALSESDRQKAFYTWDLGAGDIVIEKFDAQQLRVIYMLSASSKYTSHFIRLSYITAGVVCLAVYACTACRINLFFHDLLILDQLHSMPATSTSPSSRMARPIDDVSSSRPVINGMSASEDLDSFSGLRINVFSRSMKINGDAGADGHNIGLTELSRRPALAAFTGRPLSRRWSCNISRSTAADYSRAMDNIANYSRAMDNTDLPQELQTATLLNPNTARS